MFAYVGGYTTSDRDGRGDGINVYRIDQTTGAWSHVQNIGGLENPSLFTLRRDKTRLYSVHGGRNLVSAFARDATSGRLTLLNQMDCQGNNPVDSALDATERFLVIGNYGTGTVAVMPLEADGRLLPVSQLVTLKGTPGPDPHHQTSSHPHAVIFDPVGEVRRRAGQRFRPNFLLPLRRWPHPADRSGIHRLAPGAAPRHTVFHPSLPVLYVNNELDSTVTVYRWDGTNGMPRKHSRDDDPGRPSRAEYHRGDRRIPVRALPLRLEPRPGRGGAFRIAPTTGQLTYGEFTRTGGRRPRFFTLDPSGERLYAANQDSDDITAFGSIPRREAAAHGVVASNLAARRRSVLSRPLNDPAKR